MGLHACKCINCQNTELANPDLQLDGGAQELELEDIAREHELDEELVDDSDVDEELEERMREDKELNDVMDIVFGLDSDEDELQITW